MALLAKDVNTKGDFEAFIHDPMVPKIDDIETALSNLTSLDLVMLRVEGSIKVRELLNSIGLTPFWENKFNKLRLPKDTSFSFRDPAPQTKADFYCGYILFLAALENKSDNILFHTYLVHSIEKFDCFYAIQLILVEKIKAIAIENTIEAFNLYLKDIVSMRQAAVQQHRTPGCILLANIYLALAIYYQRLTNQPRANLCYIACWEQIHLAELLESSSTRQIHNAYFGKGLAYSNSLGLNSIVEFKTHVSKLAKDALKDSVKRVLESKAKSTFDRFFKVEEDTPSLKTPSLFK